MTMPSLTPAGSHETITKMGWTVLPHPAHIPDLAPCDYGPVNNALHGCKFAVDNKLRQSFVMCFEAKTENFTMLVYSILLNAGKTVKNDDSVEKLPHNCKNV
jgi:hypothetical protein